MWLQHGRNSGTGSSSQQGTSINGAKQDQSSQRMESANKNKRSGKLLGICELLSEVYSELQSYNKTIEWSKKKKEMEMGRRTSTSLWWTKGQDYKSTSTFSSEKRRKI